MKNCAGKGN